MSESVCKVQIAELPEGMRFGGARHRAYRRRMTEKSCAECGCPMSKHYRASGCEGCKEANKEMRRQQWREEMGYVS